MRNAETFVLQALVASAIASPKNPGLTLDELVDLGREENYGPGEISDAVRQHRTDIRNRLIFGLGTHEHFIGMVDIDYQPEFRNLAAMDHIHKYFYEQRRQVGSRAVGAERSVLVADGVREGISENDMEVAITLLLSGRVLEEKEGEIKPGHIGTELHTSKTTTVDRMQLPSGQIRPLIERIRDKISRRNGGRPTSTEPLEAFRSILPELGYQYFVTWWTELAAELRAANPKTAPTSITVIAAAMAEGALSLIVTFAQGKGLTMKNLQDPKRNWKFEALVSAAKTGSDPIIKDEVVAMSCMRLNKDRQRIHAGRLLDSPADYPYPEFRSVEAREATRTLDLLLRAIIDWFTRNK